MQDVVYSGNIDPDFTWIEFVALTVWGPLVQSDISKFDLGYRLSLSRLS